MTDWTDRRRQAAWRQRRIIMNNDGDDAGGRHIAPGIEPTTEAFRSQRCTGLENTQVDSIVYCTGGCFDQHSLASRCDESSGHPPGVWGESDLTRHWADRGRDALGMVIDFCRAHDKEIIWSLRMNDIHDNWYPATMPRFKKDHPELLLFQPDDVGRKRPGPDWSEPHMSPLPWTTNTQRFATFSSVSLSRCARITISTASSWTSCAIRSSSVLRWKAGRARISTSRL